MKVLVLGGSGFLGSHVVDLLVAEGHDVLVIDDHSSCWLDSNDKPRFANAGAAYTDRQTRESAEAEVVVDAALRHPLDRELALYRRCLERVDVGARFVLDGAIARKLKRYVVVSSLEVHADSRTMLGSHLRAYVETLGYLHRPPHLDVEFVELPELYGPRQLPDAGFVAAAINGAQLLSIRPSFAHLGFVRDAAAVVVHRAIRKPHRKPIRWTVGAPCIDAESLVEGLRKIGREELVDRVHVEDEPTQSMGPDAIDLDEVVVETSLASGLEETVEFYAATRKEEDGD